MPKKPKPIFQFSNVVVVNGSVGSILKTWDHTNSKHQEKGFYYEVYIREFNTIIEYHEKQIQHFVYSKTLSKKEESYYEPF